jgi:hypothetical protein
LPRAIASWQLRAAHGLACREPSAKSQTAPRSCLLTAHRKVTALCWPDWRAGGAAPARQISAWGSGKRARQSPIPGGQPGGADGARAGQRGEGVAVGVGGELGGDLGPGGLDLGVQAGQHGGQGAGHLGASGSLRASSAPRRRPQPLV